ncbi:MAG: hypothetical protein JJU30_12970 [Alkalimonas sp.]|nr:hypothetical protein [Alkalimonas sp.]
MLFAVVFYMASHFIGQQQSEAALPSHSADQGDEQTEKNSLQTMIFPPVFVETDGVLAADEVAALADVLPLSDFWWVDDDVQAELTELGFVVGNPAAGYIRFATEALLSLSEQDDVAFVLPLNPEVVVRAEVTSMQTLQTGAVELLLHDDRNQLVASIIVLDDKTIDGVLYLQHETFAFFAVHGVGWIMNANAMFPVMDGHDE